MPVHTIGLTFKTDAGSVPISSVLFSVDSEINEAILVPAGTTKQVALLFATARINDYCVTLLNATGKTEAITGQVDIAWNSQANPQPAMPVIAKKPLWHAPGFGTTNVFTTDINVGYFTNPGLVDLVVAIHIGQNLVV